MTKIVSFIVTMVAWAAIVGEEDEIDEIGVFDVVRAWRWLCH